MPDYRRRFVPGGAYCFTQAVNARGTSALLDHIDGLRHAYGWTCRTHPFKTLAVCILPDHMHAIWCLPKGDHDYSERWRLLKRRFHQTIGRRAVLQARFWEHTITSEGELHAGVHYVEQNAVKHGLVCDPAMWPHSSWHRRDRFLQVTSTVDLVSLPPTWEGFELDL